MLYNALVMAQQAQQAQPSTMESIVAMAGPILIFGVIFYFLLIRPQMKESKRREQMLNEIKSGDKVIISGGIHGTVANVKEQTFVVKIADNVKVEVSKSGVAAVLGDKEENKEDNKK